MLTVSGILIYSPKGKVACSITGGKGCEVARTFTKITFWSSVIIFLTGAFFAYGLYPLQRLLGL